MIPAQDHLPLGCLGNLVALPLQGQALLKGNSAFVDEDWQAYTDQWERLKSVRKLEKNFVEEKVKEWGAGGVLGDLASADDDGDIKPWVKPSQNFHAEDVQGKVKIIFANQIFVQTDNLKPRLQNQIRRLAAYSNPEFYKKQAMGFVGKNVRRIVSCAYDENGYICLPRGCHDALAMCLKTANIPYKEIDCRQNGRKIAVKFVGELYPEQKSAVNAMLFEEMGILEAATAFGKTVVGAYLIAARKVNTLILVQNIEIMRNWQEDCQKFLHFDEALPTYTTPKGKIRQRKSHIGCRYSGHDALTGIVDVAMISSFGRDDDVDIAVRDYGMVIVDECHHAASVTA